MKKGPFALVLIISTVFTHAAFCQHPLDVLESAYKQFEAKKFQKSAELFDVYFKTYPATFNDFYFAALANALSGRREKANEYTENAAIGIESFDMMLADPGFKLIHSDISVKRNALAHFYKQWDLPNRSRRQQRHVIDSLYFALPSRKLSQDRFGLLLRNYTQAVDTTKFLTIVDDMLKSAGHGVTAYRWQRNQNIISSASRRAPDGVRKNLERRYIGRSDLTQAEVDYHEQKKDYSSLTTTLLRLSYEQPEHFTKVLSDRQLVAYFRSTEGQRFLKFWIDMNIIPTTEVADVVALCTETQYTSAKEVHYNYLKANHFKGIAPRSFDQYHPSDESGKTYTISRSYLDELPSHNFNIQITVADGKISFEKAAGLEDHPKAILIKRIPESSFAELAGEYAIMPQENFSFINMVRQGKWKKSDVARVQERRLKPLTEIRFVSRLESMTDEGEESVVFALEANMNWLLEVLLAPLNRNIDRNKKINMLRTFKIRSPEIVDHLIAELKKAETYNAMLDVEKTKYKRLIGEFVSALPEVIIQHPDFAEAAQIRNELSSVDEKDITAYCTTKAEKISSAWTTFKSASPFGLPSFVKHDELPATDVPKPFKHFIVLGDEIVYFDYAARRFLYRSEEISLGESTSDTVQVESATAVRERPLQPLIQGAFFSGAAVMVTSNHSIHTPVVEPLILSKKELDDVQKLSMDLNLQSPREIRLGGGGFDLRYDRLYALKPSGKPLLFYHRDREIVGGFLSDPRSFANTAKVFHDSLSGTCVRPNSGREYTSTETVHTLSSLKVERFNDDKLVVMASASVTSRLSCDPYTPARIIFKMLDRELNIVKEVVIPAIGGAKVELNSNPDIALKVVGDNVFGFIMSSCCGDNPLYMVVLDSNLNIIKPLHDITADVGFKANSLTSLPILEHNKELYIAYGADAHGKNIIEIRRIRANGEVSSAAHIALMKDYSQNIATTKKGDAILFHYLHQKKTANTLITVRVKFDDLLESWK